MTLADLTPDVALAALLKDNVKLRSSTSEEYAVEVYAQALMPNTGLGKEFLTVQNNGVINSWTNPIGQFNGNLALTLYCKANANNTANTARLRQMVAQCVELIDRKRSQDFFFRLDPTNVITPPYVNPTNGYATTTINVAWHTTDN